MQARRVVTVLVVSDVEKARRFFVEKLGFELAIDIGWFASVTEPATKAEVSLWRAGHETLPAQRSQVAQGVAVAFMVDDVDSEVAKLVGRGVEVLQPATSHPWGQRNALFAGPDGVMIDLLQAVAPDPQWLRANGLG